MEKQHARAIEDLNEVKALLAETATKGTDADPILTTIRQAVETCRKAATNDPSVLRASRSGVVSCVLRQPGDVVTGGEPVVRGGRIKRALYHRNADTAPTPRPEGR